MPAQFSVPVRMLRLRVDRWVRTKPYDDGTEVSSTRRDGEYENLLWIRGIDDFGRPS